MEPYSNSIDPRTYAPWTSSQINYRPGAHHLPLFPSVLLADDAQCGVKDMRGRRDNYEDLNGNLPALPSHADFLSIGFGYSSTVTMWSADSEALGWSSDGRVLADFYKFSSILTLEPCPQYKLQYGLHLRHYGRSS